VLFAAQVSHDLRTPLTAVLANAEMLAAEPVVSQDQDLGWMVAAVERGARRMDTMIEQMLAYARGGGAPVLATTPLGSVFDHALEELGPLVEEQQAEVVVDCLPTLPVDAEQLRAVAHELVSNALRFSRPGVRPRVAVCSRRLPDHWRVSVSDNGIGIEADRREAMLLPFARADKRVEGSGMGLAIATRVVEAHGGRIGIDAGPDGGTTVWFDLPV
jgi:signal transduction histidine kinase